MIQAWVLVLIIEKKKKTLLAISFLAAHTIHHWLPAHNEDPFEVSTVFTHTYLRKSNSWLKFVTQLCKSPH